MKKRWMTVCAAALLAAGAVRAQQVELVAFALKDAVDEARVSLAGSKIPAGEPVAILPIAGDVDAHIAGLLKNALVAAGKTCVEGKEDPMWESILKEIEWDARKEDILDTATLDKFGKLKSAKCLLYGWTRRLSADDRSVVVELELHCSRVATKEHVWGGSFVRRHYVPGADPKGVTGIPDEIRQALIGGIRDEIRKSLAASKKLASVKKVAMLPVAGDIDQYAAGLFRDVLAASPSLTPVNLDVATRAEARFALREGNGLADAVAYGVLRDMNASLDRTKWYGEKIYRARMELQLWIEKGATREILWSDTVRYAKEFSIFGEIPHIVWILAGCVVVLILFAMFLRAYTRVR